MLGLNFRLCSDLFCCLVADLTESGLRWFFLLLLREGELSRKWSVGSEVAKFSGIWSLDSLEGDIDRERSWRVAPTR